MKMPNSGTKRYVIQPKNVIIFILNSAELKYKLLKTYISHSGKK